MALRATMVRNALPPLIVVVILIASLLIYDAYRSPTTFCYGSSSIPRHGLTPTGSTNLTTSPQGSQAAPTTLPPSHDNDAGISRQHDATPDADVDTYQRPQFCIRNGHHVLAH